MRIARIVMGGLLLMLLVTGAMALDPANIIISANKSWVVAGSNEISSVVTTVYDSTGNPVDPPVQVRMFCENPVMGSISTKGTWQPTDVNGRVFGTYKPGIKSGDAVLYAEIRASSLNNSTTVQVDHAEPKQWSMVDYPPSSPVNSVVTITVRLSDAYDNIVENRRIAEVVTFRGPEGVTAGFRNGTVYTSFLPVEVGADGNASVLFRTDRNAGDNFILITAPPTVISNQQWITIKGMPGTPATIQSVVVPSVGKVLADNIETFTITYRVEDNLGNPIPSVPIWRNTTPLDEHDRFITNEEGVVSTTYGPKSGIGIIDIVARVEGYSNVSITDTVEFVPGGAAMWEVSANPQVMASRDVNLNTRTNIMAKVMDSFGNPVPNIPIDFTITGITNNTRLTALPELESYSALTDEDGFATVIMRPGAFPRSTEEGYNQNAIGTVTVQATWGSKTKDIVITFKNYALLRVETSIDPLTVGVNDTINVTIQLVGDGWALQPIPINAVLATDRSGSMMYDNPDRMTAIMAAMRTFIGEMNFPRDRIGIVSFGQNGMAQAVTYTPSGNQPNGQPWPQTGPGMDYTSSDDSSYINQWYPGLGGTRGRHSYSDYATVDIGLSPNPLNINSTINSTIPYSGTPMRSAIFKAINEIRTNGSADATRAIILLSDGDYNWFGDPLARDPSRGQTWSGDSFTDLDTDWYRFSSLTAPEQNLSVYAKNNNIQIYSIAFGNYLTPQGRDTLRILAESTNGTYYTATATDIASVYQNISHQLQRMPVATETKMNLAYQTLNVSYNNITSPVPGYDVFTYLYVQGSSTHVSSWNESGILPDHVPLPPYPEVDPSYGGYTTYNYSYNQSSDWTATPPHLYFNIGNISLNQTWETKFSLKALTPGSINLFNPGSQITFRGNDGTSYSLNLPETLASVINLSPQIESQAQVDVKDLQVINDTGPGTPSLQWLLDYNSPMPSLTSFYYLNQNVFYKFSPDNVTWSDSWIRIGSIRSPSGPFGDLSQSYDINVQYTGWYRFRVFAKEDIYGGASDEEETGPIYLSVRGIIIIK